MAPTVFRSSDAGSPILTGAKGSLANLLDKCLVAGYGSTKATGTITQAGTPANNDTITVDGTTYTFKTALTPAANEVLINGAAGSLVNLAAAIMGYGTSGTTYGAGTTQKYTVQVTANSGTVLTIEATTGGTGGNSIAMSKSSANYTVSANLSGGAGTDTRTSAGWTKPYSSGGKAVFRQAAGNQFYWDVDDDAPGATAATNCREARSRGYEAMTAVATGTNAFPTVASAAAGAVLMKTATSDQTNRSWIIVADDRTVYVFIASGQTAGVYGGFMFGDIYSLVSGDGYRTMVVGRTTEAQADQLVATEKLAGLSGQSTPFTAITGHWIARGYSGIGGQLSPAKAVDYSLGSNVTVGAGTMSFPHPTDGGNYLSRVYLQDPTTGALNSRRGWMRGFWHSQHAISHFIDGDTFTGTGDLAGRTFLVIKSFSTTGLAVIETSNTWDTSS